MSEWMDAYRVVTFIPEKSAPGFADTITALVPPLGHYDRVAWWGESGTEQFRPLAGANPAHGTIGKTERMPSVRLEFSLPADDVLLEKITASIRANHPWESPVILVFPHKMPISMA
jgi:hypothetical protein